MKVLASLLLALALPSIAAARDDEEEIRRLDRENTVATWTADARWFEQNLADDFVIITVNGKVKTKKEVISDLVGSGFAMEPYEPTEVQIRIYAETAVVTGRVQQKFVRRGVRYQVDARYTDVYVRRKGRWWLVTAHASPVMQVRKPST